VPVWLRMPKRYCSGRLGTQKEKDLPTASSRSTDRAIGSRDLNCPIRIEIDGLAKRRRSSGEKRYKERSDLSLLPERSG
jgi:hypothetical protein